MVEEKKEDKKNPIQVLYEKELRGYLRISGPGPKPFVAKILKNHPALLTATLSEKTPDKSDKDYTGTLLHIAINAGIAIQGIGGTHEESDQLAQQVFDTIPQDKLKAILATKDSGGQMPLQRALNRGLYKLATRMIDSGAPITDFDVYGTNILHWAVKNDNPHALKELGPRLKKIPRADLDNMLKAWGNVTTYDNETLHGTPYHMLRSGNTLPLLFALDGGKGLYTKDFTGKTPFDLIVKDVGTSTQPVMLWYEYGHDKCEAGINKLYALHKMGKLDKQHTEYMLVRSLALHHSTLQYRNRDVPEYKELPVKIYADYAKRTDVKASDKDEYGQKLVEIALGHNQLHLLRGAIKTGYQPKREDMELAMKMSNVEGVEMLLDANAPKDGKDYFALFSVAKEKRAKMLELLVKHKTPLRLAVKNDPSVYEGDEKLSPLLVAVRGNNGHIVRLLLENNLVDIPGAKAVALANDAEKLIRDRQTPAERNKPLTDSQQDILRMIEFWEMGWPIPDEDTLKKLRQPQNNAPQNNIPIASLNIDVADTGSLKPSTPLTLKHPGARTAA